LFTRSILHGGGRDLFQVHLGQRPSVV